MSDVPIVDDAAAEVPEPVVTPEPVRVDEPEAHEESRPAFVDEIMGRLDAIDAKLVTPEIAPVVEPEVRQQHETPVKPPWTHRGFGRGR